MLLTAYSDTEAAIRAINEIKLNHYLLKPWDPPEQNLYPVLDDLLDDWQGILPAALRRPARARHALVAAAPTNCASFWRATRCRTSGSTWKPPTAIRKCAALWTCWRPRSATSPWCCSPTAAALPDPSHAATGRPHRPQYARRRRVLRSDHFGRRSGGPRGGRLWRIRRAAHRDRGARSARRPGRPERPHRELPGLSVGPERRRSGAPRRGPGAPLRRGDSAPQEAVTLRIQDPYRIVRLADGSEISAEALLIATGVQWRKLDVPGMDRLTGAGVYYGAGSTEAVSCRDDDVYIVGGANSAGQAALNFSRYARRVVMLVRGKSLAATMSQYLIDEIGTHAEYPGGVSDAGRGGARRGSSGRHHHRMRAHQHARTRGRQCAVHLHRRAARHRLAGWRGGARRTRLHPDRLRR